MKLAAPLALLLVAGLVGCGSSTVNQRHAIVKLIRADAVKKGSTYLEVHSVRISKLDPQYAVAHEVFGGSMGPTGENTWILRRNSSTWKPTSVEAMFPVCSAAPAKVLKELIGSAACYPPAGVYTSIPWTRGTSVRLRYCQRPSGPGGFVAASKGVTCETASVVVYAMEQRCRARGSCDAAGFRCRSYWSGTYGQPFENVHHGLCTNGGRRIAWDGG